MGRLIGSFLRVLADYADTMDCERPEAIMQQIIENKVVVPVEQLQGLAHDMEDMKDVIGGIGLRVKHLEEQSESDCKVISLNKKNNENTKEALHNPRN